MAESYSLSRALGMRRFGDPALNDDIGMDRWLSENANDDWQREGRVAGRYAWRLVDTDPYAAALAVSIVKLTVGTAGLCFRSKYQLDDNPETSEQERAVRRAINGWTKLASEGCQLDIGGCMPRSMIEGILELSRAVSGDGFAVRVFRPDRPGAVTSSAWRLISPERVCNPSGVGNWQRPIWRRPTGSAIQAPEGHEIFEGIEVDADKRPVALWIETRSGQFRSEVSYTRVEYQEQDGTPNVIHRFVPLKPGQLRGFSDLAPIYVTAKQLSGTNEAYMVGKRATACLPIFFKSSDEKIAAQWGRHFAQFGPNTTVRPGMFGYLGDDADVFFPNWQFQGSDHAEYVKTAVRAMAASKGIPWQFVMSHIEGVSMSSGRIVIDMAMQAGESFREAFIPQVSAKIDEVIIREGVARRRIPVRSIARARRGSYLPPRAPRLDPNREADAMLKGLAMGKSPTRVFGEMGIDFEDEIMQTKQDQEFLRAQGINLPEVKIVLGAAGNDDGDDNTQGDAA